MRSDNDTSGHVLYQVLATNVTLPAQTVLHCAFTPSRSICILGGPSCVLCIIFGLSSDLLFHLHPLTAVIIRHLLLHLPLLAAVIRILLFHQHIRTADACDPSHDLIVVGTPLFRTQPRRSCSVTSLKTPSELLVRYEHNS